MNPFDKQEIDVITKRTETTQEQLIRVFSEIENMGMSTLVLEYCHKYGDCSKCPLHYVDSHKGRSCIANIIHYASKDFVNTLKAMPKN